MIRWIKEQWLSPFPDTCDLKHHAKTMAVIGLFITAFLLVFEPFGFSGIQSAWLKWRMAAEFGLVTFVVGLFWEWFEIRVLKAERESARWTFGRWIQSITVLIVLISLGNLTLNQLYNPNAPITLERLIYTLANTLSLGLFPTIASGYVAKMRAMRRNETLATSLGKLPVLRATHLITIPSDTDENYLQMAANRILFVNAMENYVAVHYTDGSQVRKELVRNTLRRLDSVLSIPFFRCHRSFLVNLEQVERVEGNAQGLRLSLKTGTDIIPVSRKYLEDFRNYFQKTT